MAALTSPATMAALSLITAQAGAMASSPPDAVQVAGFELLTAGDQQEETFDLGDRERDEARIVRRLVV